MASMVTLFHSLFATNVGRDEDDWESDDDEEAELKNKFGIDRETKAALKLAKRKQTKGTAAQKFKGYTTETVD